MWCHLILGLPVMGLLLFLVLPFWPSLGLYAVLVAISGLVYWKVAEALRAPVRTGVEGLLGAEGVALSDLAGEGLVRLQGAVWQARAGGEAIPQGERVRVVAIHGLVLRVERSARPFPAWQGSGVPTA